MRTCGVAVITLAPFLGAGLLPSGMVLVRGKVWVPPRPASLAPARAGRAPHHPAHYVT
ncbi:cell division protein FtsQ, partial [Pseudomonas syringae]